MSIDFRVRDFFHPRQILRLHRTFERNQWLPLSEVRKYQERLLERTLDQAFNAVPYYQQLAAEHGFHRRDFQSPEDLRKLPLLRKETLRAQYGALTARDAARYHARVYRTSGTSGEPVRFLLDAGANTLEFVYYWRHWGWGGYRLGDRFAEISGHFFLIRPHKARLPYVYQPHLRRLVLNGLLLDPVNAAKMAEMMQRLKIKFLHGLAGALQYFVLALEEAEIRPFSLDCVFSTGEILLSHGRKALTRFFGCPVLDSFGHMERTVAVSECPEGGYHVNTDYGLLQLENVAVDPRTNVARGRIVGTTLHNMAMPLLRYDVGDEVEFRESSGPCRCGRSFPLIWRILGRSQDVLQTPDGRYVTGLFFLPELVEGVDAVQFIQTAPDRLEIRWMGNMPGSSEGAMRLAQLTRDMVGPSMHVESTRVRREELQRDPSGKIRPFISLCQVSALAASPGEAEVREAR
ncbi:MAG TPA: hypothetical protein P5057_07270 [Acidobacteriota bacterium]|nr:hypothetical protein [Acidobacteriota bacterium]